MADFPLAAVKAALSDVKGIADLTVTYIGGRMVFAWDGIVAAVDPAATLAEVEDRMRKAVALRASAPPQQPAAAPTEGTATMSTPAPAPGSFAASLRAMMNEARAGVEKAKSEGLAQVQDAVGKLNEAKEATTKVAGSMAKQIHDEAASVLSELGQISNDLG